MNNDSKIAVLENTVTHIDRDLLDIKRDLKDVRNDFQSKFSNLSEKIDTNFRWIIGIIFTSWLTTLLTIFFKH